MNFIKLTEKDGTKVFINMDRVTALSRTGAAGMTEIVAEWQYDVADSASTPTRYFVVETPEEIFEKFYPKESAYAVGGRQ